MFIHEIFSLFLKKAYSRIPQKSTADFCQRCFFTTVSGSLSRGRILLSSLHSPPVEEGIKVVDKEGYKAYHHRKIGNILYRRQHPKHYQNDVVKRISERKIRTPSEYQTSREKAGCHRKGADGKVCRVKISQYVIKHTGNDGGKYENDQ